MIGSMHAEIGKTRLNEENVTKRNKDAKKTRQKY